MPISFQPLDLHVAVSVDCHCCGTYTTRNWKR